MLFHSKLEVRKSEGMKERRVNFNVKEMDRWWKQSILTCNQVVGSMKRSESSGSLNGDLVAAAGYVKRPSYEKDDGNVDAKS